LAVDADVPGVNGTRDIARAALAAAALFAVCGFWIVRLALPEDLRRHEALWVLPVGACAAAAELAVLAYAGVPLRLSLVVVLGAGVGAAVAVLRRRGRGERPAALLAWPLWLAVLLTAVALIPVWRTGYVTVIGSGSDAIPAVGTADFLQHNHPLEIDTDYPLDRVPLVWRSKPPIYLVLGAVGSLSGLEPYQAIATTAAILLALAALGFFLLARELLGTGVLAAGCAMAVTGLDRMVLHTGMHPYFNQTWGYFTMPFALVLAWWTVRRRSRGALCLLGLFLAIGAFAYPLALPFPLIMLAVAWYIDRRERRGRGEPVRSLDPRRLYRGRRSLLWLVPAVVVLAVPVLGVLEKVRGAAIVVLNPDFPLDAWGGDLFGFIPDHHFYAMPDPTTAGPAVLAMFGFTVLALRRVPRPLAWGLGAVILFGLVSAAYFRQRDFGWYFHFKTLAFAAPVVLTCAVAGAARLRRLGPILLVGLVVAAVLSVRPELRDTHPQLIGEHTWLRDWARELPPGSSIRLDMSGGQQLWAAYFLSRNPLCSEKPLLNTSYPHVPISRRADFVVVETRWRRPFDAVGAPIQANDQFVLYRLDPATPGPENCSRRMVQTVGEGDL
jgi:hypothetical protein